MDAERKLIVALETLFPLSDLEEATIELASERPYCPSCLNNIIMKFNNKYAELLGDNFQFYYQEGNNVRNLDDNHY